MGTQACGIADLDFAFTEARKELDIGAMDAVAIQAPMPAIVQCFAWLDRLRANSV